MQRDPINPLAEVNKLGQSLWLDFISRQFLHDGQLQRLIDEDSLQGMTSNPAIFEKAMAGSADYDEDIGTLARQGKSTREIYEAMAVADVQLACEKFLPVYQDPKGNRTDGFVSLEVAPDLVHDTQGTIEEGRRLWQAVNRPNLMIKVPGTLEGLPAIGALLREGINVNVTLLFSVERYQQVVETYLTALEERARANQPVAGIASVASFFLSRIDLLVDPQLEELIRQGGAQASLARSMVGQIAIASAKRAYQFYQQAFGGKRFERLVEQGASSQRLLWASTGNKNPAYSPLKYVEALVGPKTVNTLPLETLQAYREGGQPQARLEEGLPQAEQVLDRLPEVGIDLAAATRQLEREGIKKFVDPFTQLMAGLDKKRQQASGQPKPAQDWR